MSKLVKITKELCDSCIYSSDIGSCDYLIRTDKSRIFSGRTMLYDPSYCDKYMKCFTKEMTERCKEDV